MPLIWWRSPRFGVSISNPLRMFLLISTCRSLRCRSLYRRPCRPRSRSHQRDVQAAWEALTRWLGKITESEGSKILEALRDQPWVLARKGSFLEFLKAVDVLYRAEAGEILDKQFWVIAGSLPAPLANFRNKLGFLDLPSNRQTIEALAVCLSQSHSASTAASMDVYRLVARLIRGTDPTIKCTWLDAASSSPVYRLFRSPEAWMAGERLYVGTDELRTDFGDQLCCVSVLKDSDPDVLQLYRDLGVPEVPTLAQTVAALSRIGSCRTFGAART